MENHKSWNKFMKTHEKEWGKIKRKLGNDHYPDEESKIFRFLGQNLNNVKLVIFGKEPYNKDATGRAFEVENINGWIDKTRHTSLQNIFKALYYNKTKQINDIKFLREKYNENDNLFTVREWFDKIENQGILLLNAALTVSKSGESHFNIWKDYRKKLIEFLHKTKPNIKLIVLGKMIESEIRIVNTDCNFYFYYHPRNRKFIKDNPFKRFDIIDWDYEKY